MKLIILILILLMQGYYCAYSQNFIIKRTDVLNEDARFVTATYKFGFEIYLDGLPKSNSISFRLIYDQKDYIKFSQWNQGDYNVLQAVNIDIDEERSSLIIGVSSGLFPQPDENTLPKVIELEFVVLKNAPNLENLFMTFDRPVATALDSTGGISIPISTQPLNFVIHSYVNVWPGDTDNNGAVDHLDFVPVSQYIGMGSATKGFKSFKRHASSALWTPQRVLTWDSSAVTYVDCDGNGDITTSDMLIVTYNLGKDTLNPHGKTEEPDRIQSKITNQIFADESNYSYPVQISSERDFSGVAGYIELLSESNEFVGIDLGKLLPEDNYLHFFQKDNYIYFVSSNELKSKNKSKTGEIFKLVFNSENPSFAIRELNAIDFSGNIFSLKGLSSITNTEDEVEISINNTMLNVMSHNIINYIEIFDISGNILVSQKIENIYYSKNLAEFTTGTYLIKLTSNNSEIIKKINLVK
ncbi:MAG: T9SS type A sorting domain-containing protein [Candidatus Kapabacteria bacterium]|nr:T9SS type A sorting domain-containing protein [Ignavibacteriota bacterium]MCW5885624.1 T9SS type A sorting domain-containing protein [Candidatus Kapabacteria bacterium]